MNKTCILGLLTMAMILGAGTDVVGQRIKKKRKKDLATIKGRIVQNSDPDLRLPYSELNIRLLEQVDLPLPKTTNGYDDWEPLKQKKWVDAYEASAEGKKLIAKRQKLHDAAHNFDIKVEKNGKFIVYDVPPGRYGMHGRADKKIENKRYAFEVYGQIDVGKKVDELDLAPLMISTTRVLSRGEKTPRIELETFDGKSKLKNSHLRKKYVLMFFWSQSSLPSVEFLKVVQKAQSEIHKRPNFVFLSVSLDESRKEALEFVKDNRILGWHGYAGGWEHKTVREFGVSGLPSLYLLGDDGKVLMIHNEFLYAFGTGKKDLTQIVDDRIAGRDAPDVRVPTEKVSDNSTGPSKKNVSGTR